MGLISYIKNKIKEQDNFGAKVEFTYKKDSSYKTVLGGWLTILMMWLLFSIWVLFLKALFERTKVNTNSTQEILNFRTGDPEKHKVFEGGRNILYFITPPRDDIYRYIYPVASESKITYDGQDISNIETSFVDIGTCSDQYFSTDLVDRVIIENNYWIIETNVTLRGDITTQNRSEFQILFFRWTDFYWASNAEIDYFLENSYISFIFQDAYVDYKDFETPIKEFVWSKVSYFHPYEIAFINLKVRENRHNFQDSLFIQNADGGHFYTFTNYEANSRLNYYQASPFVLVLTLQMDYQVDYHERQVSTFWNFIGEIGGIFEIFKMGLGLFLGIYSGLFLSLDFVNTTNKAKHVIERTNQYAEETKAQSVEVVDLSENKSLDQEKRKRGNDGFKYFTVFNVIRSKLCLCPKKNNIDLNKKFNSEDLSWDSQKDKLDEATDVVEIANFKIRVENELNLLRQRDAEKDEIIKRICSSLNIDIPQIIKDVKSEDLKLKKDKYEEEEIKIQGFQNELVF